MKLKATTLGVVALSSSIAFLCLGDASAQPSPTQVLELEYEWAPATASVALSQVLQVNVVNDSAATADPRHSALVIQARVVDSDGVAFAGSARQTLPRGATFSWRISRDELSSVPADELGRVQTRVVVTIRGVRNSGAFVPSLELINVTTGVTEFGMIGDTRTVISEAAAR